MSADGKDGVDIDALSCAVSHASTAKCSASQDPFASHHADADPFAEDAADQEAPPPEPAHAHTMLPAGGPLTARAHTTTGTTGHAHVKSAKDSSKGAKLAAKCM